MYVFIAGAVLVALFEVGAESWPEGDDEVFGSFLGGDGEGVFGEVDGVPAEGGDVSEALAAGVEGGEDEAAPFVVGVGEDELEFREGEWTAVFVFRWDGFGVGGEGGDGFAGV